MTFIIVFDKTMENMVNDFSLDQQFQDYLSDITVLFQYPEEPHDFTISTQSRSAAKKIFMISFNALAIKFCKASPLKGRNVACSPTEIRLALPC